MKRILITGANGRMGRCITQGLRETGEYEVIATSRTPDPDFGILPMDVRDFQQVLKLTEGVDTIIHLAWYMKPNQFEEMIIPINVVGTYHIYEAARINGVRRVVFGSSNHVTGYYRTDEKVTPESPYRPSSSYGWSNCAGELLGRMYSDKYGISCINVRIGNFTVEDKPPSLTRLGKWLSHRDTVQLFKCCIEASDEIKYLILYGTSNNTRNLWDIEYLEDLIGYKPQDDSEIHKEYAEKTNRWNGVDDNGYQGAEQLTWL